MCEIIAVVAGGQVEVLTAIARNPLPSKLAPGVLVTYLGFLDTVPWNLPTHQTGGRLGAVGAALVTEAVLMSADRGLAGRVLLRSLPQSEELYRKVGMTEIAATTAGGLVYFEHTQAQATDFLRQQGLPIWPSPPIWKSSSATCWKSTSRA